MHNFNEIQITNDLTYLIKDKDKHDDNELKRHWINILDESFKLSKDNAQKKFFRDRAELLYLEMKLTFIGHALELKKLSLEDEHIKQLDEILKKYRVTNIEQEILQTTDKINLKISQFNKQYNTDKNGNFDKTLATMRINGYHVNRHDITVTEWIALLEQIKNQNSVSNARGSKK